MNKNTDAAEHTVRWETHRRVQSRQIWLP